MCCAACSGESSAPGIFIVVDGELGVFLADTSHDAPVHTNTLRYGESVGDLDVLDGGGQAAGTGTLQDVVCMLPLDGAGC